MAKTVEASHISLQNRKNLLTKPGAADILKDSSIICKKQCESEDLRKRMIRRMKSTGIVRKVDDLGRIVLPKELRMVLDIAERDPLEIFVEGHYIMLQKYQPSCIFCGNAKDTTVFKNKNVCKECLDELMK